MFIPMDTSRAGGGYGVTLLGACGIIEPFSVGIEAARAVAEFEGTCEVQGPALPLVLLVPDARDPSVMIDVSDGGNVRVRRLTLDKGDSSDQPPLSKSYPWLASPGGGRFEVQSAEGPFSISANAFRKTQQ